MEPGQANWFPRLALPSDEISTAIAKLLAQDPNKALNHDSPTQASCLRPQLRMSFLSHPKDGPKTTMFLTPAFLRTAETTNCHSSLHPTSAAESPEIKFWKPNTSWPIAFQTKNTTGFTGKNEAKPWLPRKGDSLFVTSSVTKFSWKGTGF